MGIVATLLPEDRCLQRVVHAVHGQHTVIPCKTWTEVFEASEDEAVHLAVVDLFADGKADFEHVRQLKLRFARITLVAYVSYAPGRSRDLFDAGRAGFDGLLIVDQDDTPASLRQVIEQAEARGVAGLIRHRLGDVHPLTRDAVLVSVTRAHMRITSHRLADILATSRRSLGPRVTRRCSPSIDRSTVVAMGPDCTVTVTSVNRSVAPWSSITVVSAAPRVQKPEGSG